MGTRQSLRKSVEAVLRHLGHDSRQVAKSLEIVGVRGSPRDSARCPLAQYLSVLIGSHASVRSVDVETSYVIVRKVEGFWRSVTIPLPDELREFVFRFDAGDFPQLIEDTNGLRHRGSAADAGTSNIDVDELVNLGIRASVR
jgi:hypothetical protein